MLFFPAARFFVAIWRIMEPGRRILERLVLSAAVFFLIVGTAAAHAVLLESNPPPRGAVIGPDVAIKLRFNVRVDSGRSRLTLVDPAGSTQRLKIDAPTPADTLSAKAAGLAPGDYRLRWQVLASDGHITRGEIPFTVTRS
jgi:methionine-rich copper-binding protein CopC